MDLLEDVTMPTTASSLLGYRRDEDALKLVGDRDSGFAPFGKAH